MKRTAFNSFHPLIAAAYFVAALVFSMAAFQPIFIVISFVIGVLFNTFLRGWRATLKTAGWQLPLLLFIALANAFFSPSGSTILFTYGQHSAVFLESALYGLFMGLMLLSVMLWFSNMANVLTSDKVMQLTGNTIPTIGLMTTMIFRLIPQFVQRGRSIGDVQNACTAANLRNENAKSARSQGFFARRVASGRDMLRNISVLMGWGMEDSLDTAEAMRARGWGAAPKRTTYQRSHFRAADGVALGIMGALVVASTIAAVLICGQFAFYPTLSPLEFSWGYVFYLAFLLIPFILEIKERIVWSK